MNRNLVSLGPLLFLLCTVSAHAQLYKWVGPDGKITYSDSPPPQTVTRVETKSIVAGGSSTLDLPFELATAVKNHPVSLYTTTGCAACDEGRKLLTERGIPFTEKTVNTKEDVDSFKKISPDAKLPVLLTGHSKETGYEASAWNTRLTAAGYPESSKLPKNYRNPLAEAVAPVAKAPAPKDSAQSKSKAIAKQDQASELPPAVGNAPPGFRF